MNCSLITMNEFINDLDVLIESLIKDLDNPGNQYDNSEIKLKYLNGITQLRLKYNLDDFNEAVKEYLTDDSGRFSFGMFIDDGFEYLSQLNTLDITLKSNPEVLEKESKVDSFSTTLELAQKSNIRGLFLNKYFILNSTGRLFFLNNFKNDIVKSIFVDESGEIPKLVNSNERMNNQIYFYKQDLKRTITDAIRLINEKTAQSFNTFESIEKALKFVEDFFIGPNSLVSQDLLYKIPLLNLNVNDLSARDRTLLKGWQAFVILSNFDPLIKLTFGKAVGINNMNLYDLDESNKYYLNLGDTNTTTWRDDNKDTDETEEIGSLPILFIESLKVYDENGNSTNLNMTFADTKVAIGKLMQLFDLQDSPVLNTVFNSTLTQILARELAPIYGLQQANDLLKQYVEGKTFKLVLAASKESPAELNPIMFRLLLPIKNKLLGNIDINPLSGTFPKKGTKTKETILSIYYNIFANTNNSLVSMSSSNLGIDPNSVTMYDFINTMILNIENKPMMEYVYDPTEGVKITTLSEKNANSRLNSITRALDGKFHKNNILGRYIDEHTTGFNNFIITDNLDDNRGINITVGDYTIGINPNLQIGIYKDDKQVTNIDNDIAEFLLFISEVLDIPLILKSGFTDNIDNKIYNIYKSLGGNGMDLIKLASHILYNYQVGKHMIKSTESSYSQDSAKYYTLNSPKAMYRLFQPSLIPSADFNTIKTVSQARDIAEGYAEVNTVRDGAGKQISTLALSSLLSKVGEIWENHTKSTESPARDFSLFSMFEGFELIRDFSGMGENKQGRTFTQSELAIASIIYDMYGDLEVVGENNATSEKADGILRIMGPVVSDKSNLPKLKFKWNSILPKRHWNDPSKPLRLRDLTESDLKRIIYTEFGEYYLNVYNNIRNLYNVVNKYVTQAAANLGLEGTAKFEYRTNFTEANQVFGPNTQAVLHEAIYLAQLAGENPEIIEQVAYIKQKGGLIENNPSIIHQLKLFGKAGSSFRTSINTDETYDEFWLRKEIQLVTDFLQSGTILKIKNGLTQRNGIAIATAIKYNQDFLHKENIAVVKIVNGKHTTKISQLSDFENWYPYRRYVQSLKQNGLELAPTHNINDPQFNIYATVEAINQAKVGLKEDDNFTIEINPEIKKHNLFDFFLGEEFIMATTGTYVSHPAKDKNIRLRESTQFGQAIKRYVSYTASKHRETANNLNGITPTLNVAIIDDYYDSGLNFNGNYDEGSIKPFDGASFYSSAMRYLDNNSLGGDAMGVDKKPFAHHMGDKSGIGFILKTAGFAVTNDRIRTGDGTRFAPFYLNLNKQMLNISWSQLMDWTKNFHGLNIDYGTWYFYDVNTNKWFARWNPRVNEKGETIFNQAEVTVTGEILNNTLQENVNYGVINTNWNLWKLFGGEYSGSIKDGVLSFEQDNTSVEMLVKAMNNVGVKKYDKVLGLNGVNQVLKKAQINIVATGGAVKYGAANVNSNQAYFDPNFHLTYMQIGSYDIGEQLDAEHHAEDGHVSLMTLVVNALGARGYSRELAEECYEALEVIAEVVNKDGLQGLEELNTSGNDQLLKNAIAQVIYKTLTRVSSDDGNLLNALAATLTEIGSSKFDWSNIEGKFPISHPAIFLKIISSISSELEKGIRLQFEGNMFVLNPSNRIFTTINGKLAGLYNSRINELIKLEELNKLHALRPYEIKIGYNYRNLETGELILVDNPNLYNEIKSRILNGEIFYETVLLQDENGNPRPLGHDLATYNAIFADVDGNYYNMWDLDSTQELWSLHESNDESAKIPLRRLLQKDLNAISEGLESTVSVGGKMIRIDKSKTQVSPYEIILPKMYKTEFGLKISDDLDSIKKDNLFFIRRSILNWKSKVNNPELYDLELKTLSGNHIYLGFTPDEINDLELTKVNIETEIDGDTMYRITPEGRRLYSIPYTINIEGKYIPDLLVYKTFDNLEIIYSNNIAHFLDEFSYNAVVFSNKPISDLRTIFELLNRSTNKTARRKIDIITKVIDKKALKKYSKIIDGIDFLALFNNKEFTDILNDESVSITFDDILNNENLLNDAIKFISGDYDYLNTQIANLERNLNMNFGVESLIRNNPLFKGMILSGIDVHTSFLQSLEMVVSRTPAQSLQSFMAMKIAAFALEDTNSAYVSRMQFLLLGSDLDIDKISLLGLIFNHGKLQTWSPYFNLKSLESFDASKKLPFPTGKMLTLVETAEKRPYDVIRNDLTISKGEFGETIITAQSGNYLSIFGTDGKYTINCPKDFSLYSPIEQYTLLRNAVSKIPQGIEINYNFDISERNLKALGIENNINTGNYDVNADFDEFNDAVLPISGLSEDLKPKDILDNIIDYSSQLDLLIRTYNKLGYIPESANEKVKNIIDYHNTYLKGKARKDAAQNFISIRTKDISKSPINLILAQAAIDELTDKVKALLKLPEFLRLVAQTLKADRGSVFSKFFLLTLTLAGKENVGIVASSLKNFEAISQYTYQTLDEGSKEDLEDLLFTRVINGHRVRMIANSYVRNPDTIKSESVLDALKDIDNDNDAFLVKSALLSLATDNTKDPTLPKLNAGPEMISLYNSGVILGLSIREVAKLVLSDTGILLSNLTKSNVFNNQKGFGRLTQAIQYLKRPPSVYFNESLYRSMAPLFERLGLILPGQTFNKATLDDILGNKYNRMTINRILRFLANPNAESSLLQFDKKLFVNTQIAQLKNSSEYRGFSKRREELLNLLLEKKANLTTDEVLTNEESELIDKLNGYKYAKAATEEQIQLLIEYRDNDVAPINLDILDALVKYEESSKEDFSKNLTGIRSNLYTNDNFSSNINEIINWLNALDVIENDLIDGLDERLHRILTQIARLDEFSQELSALRPLMALNLGIPNKLVDLLDFESNFGNIIQNRLNVIGKSNLEKYYNVGDLLSQLEEFNTKLRDLGLISNPGEYFVDLNTFVSNSEYNKLVKDIYGKIKFGINIFKIADEVNHYRAYLRIANLAIQMGKQASVVYRTTRIIEDTIVPTMNLRSSVHREAVRKNIIPAIYRRLNQEFLKSKLQTYYVPDFIIEDGKVKIKSPSKIEITLGTPEANEKFKLWIQYIEFPKWRKQFINNKFIQALGYRTYDYNVDHNLTVNLAKIRLFNMKNPSDLVMFDLTKSDLLKIAVTDSSIVDKLFYYNIIAYNNQAGLLSLTEMFEDLISANNFELIKNYNTFISEYESKDIPIVEIEDLKKEIALVLSIYELKPSLSIPYIYVRDRETGITHLLYKNKDGNSDMINNDEFEDDVYMYEEEQFSSKKLNFMNTVNNSGYYVIGLTPDNNEQLNSFIEIGNYLFSNSDKLEDNVVIYLNKKYKAKDILKMAKEKGFTTKLSEIFVKKNKKYNKEAILGALKTIFDKKC